MNEQNREADAADDESHRPPAFARPAPPPLKDENDRRDRRAQVSVELLRVAGLEKVDDLETDRRAALADAGPKWEALAVALRTAWTARLSAQAKARGGRGEWAAADRRERFLPLGAGSTGRPPAAAEVRKRPARVPAVAGRVLPWAAGAAGDGQGRRVLRGRRKGMCRRPAVARRLTRNCAGFAGPTGGIPRELARPVLSASPLRWRVSVGHGFRPRYKCQAGESDRPGRVVVVASHAPGPVGPERTLSMTVTMPLTRRLAVALAICFAASAARAEQPTFFLSDGPNKDTAKEVTKNILLRPNEGTPTTPTSPTRRRRTGP